MRRLPRLAESRNARGRWHSQRSPRGRRRRRRKGHPSGSALLKQEAMGGGVGDGPPVTSAFSASLRVGCSSAVMGLAAQWTDTPGRSDGSAAIAESTEVMAAVLEGGPMRKDCCRHTLSGNRVVATGDDRQPARLWRQQRGEMSAGVVGGARVHGAARGAGGYLRSDLSPGMVRRSASTASLCGGSGSTSQLSEAASLSDGGGRP